MTKTKRRNKGQQETFPALPEVAVQVTGHEPLVETSVDETSETPTFEHLTESEALLEWIKATDRYQALLEQTKRELAYGQALGRWIEKKHGSLSRFGQSGATPNPHVDGRKIFNPEKNLKISARRAFDWAKTGGKTADEARDRALYVVDTKAKASYSMNKTPDGVREYIDLLHQHYDKIGTPAASQIGMSPTQAA